MKYTRLAQSEFHLAIGTGECIQGIDSELATNRDRQVDLLSRKKLNHQILIHSLRTSVLMFELEL